MEFFRYLALFFIGGLGGWILELFFRRFAHGKWVNPGFLTGPCLPLYGSGVVCLYFLCNVIPYGWAGPDWAQILVKVLFIGITMTVVELIAGLIFIEGMHVKLWDYSDRWGNFKGIICPLFSLIWALIGAAYVLWVNQGFVIMTNWMLENPLPLLFVLGICLGIFSVDLGFSFHFVAKLKKALSALPDSKVVVVWEKAKESFLERQKKFQSKVHWIQPFNASLDEMKQSLEEYKARIEKELAERKAKLEAKIKAKRK